jgi:hypothetical protein
LEVVSRVWAWERVWMSVRRVRISRDRVGLALGFLVELGVGRDGVKLKVGRRGIGAGVRADAEEGVCRVVGAGSGVAVAADDATASLGSEDGGSLLLDGASRFNGVRKGDLNGLCSVLEASFSRRRFAWGVDMLGAGMWAFMLWILRVWIGGC